MPESVEDDRNEGNPREESDGERRECVRTRVSSEVTMKAVTHLMTGAGADLSVGGIYVVTSQQLPVDSLVDVEFTVDTVERRFHVVGEVRWRQAQPVGEEKRWGLGIEFLDLEGDDEEILREFVERRQPVDPAETSKEFAVVTDKAPGGERRDHLRVPISTRVHLKTVANLTSAAGSDVSVGGIYVVTPEKFAEGTTVDLEFTVEGIDREFRALGTVRWGQRLTIGDDERWGLGVEFEEIDPKDRERLREFIERREPLEADDRFGNFEVDV